MKRFYSPDYLEIGLLGSSLIQAPHSEGALAHRGRAVRGLWYQLALRLAHSLRGIVASRCDLQPANFAEKSLMRSASRRSRFIADSSLRVYDGSQNVRDEDEY
jgi:hypothetical protein